jgi:hypothetical protein
VPRAEWDQSINNVRADKESHATIQTQIDAIPDGTLATPSVIHFPVGFSSGLYYTQRPEPGGSYGCIELTARSNLVIEGPSIADPAAFYTSHPSLAFGAGNTSRKHFRVNGCTNITFRYIHVFGSNYTIASNIVDGTPWFWSGGSVSDPIDTRHYYAPWESNHAFEVINSTNVTIHDFAVDDMWGDGVRTSSDNVTIRDGRIDGNGRQSIAIVDGSTVVIDNVDIGMTVKARRQGVDIEPPLTSNNVNGVEIRNCQFKTNFSGILALGNGDKQNIEIHHNDFWETSARPIHTGGGGTRVNWSVHDNTHHNTIEAETTVTPYRFSVVNNVVVANNVLPVSVTGSRVAVSFGGCTGQLDVTGNDFGSGCYVRYTAGVAGDSPIGAFSGNSCAGGCAASCVAIVDDIALWRRSVISIKNSTYTGNPFELEIDATFTHTGTSTQITLPGYYAGADTWKIGFMPTLTGEWTCVTSSSDTELNGVAVTVTAISGTNKGLLAADATDGRKWAFADGTYLGVPIGLRMEVFWESATQAQFDAAADFLQANNLNFMDTRLQNESTSTPLKFTVPWQDHNFNLTLWDQMEARLESLTDRGLGIYIMVYTDAPGDPPWAGQSATEALVLRYMVARFTGYPFVIWDTGIDIAEYRSQADVNWLGQRIRDLDPYDHPISSRHGGGSGTIVMSGQTYDSRGDRTAVIATMVSLFTGSSIPVGMFDAWGENRPSHPTKNFTENDIRRAAWKCVMAGGLAMITRGSDGFYHFASVASDMESETWLSFINPLVQTKFGSTFGSMVPQSSLVGSGNGYCLADSPTTPTRLLYWVVGVNDSWDSGTGGNITFKLTGVTGSFAGIRYDPRLGTETAIGTFAGGSDYVVTPPHAGDWAWVLTLV